MPQNIIRIYTIWFIFIFKAINRFAMQNRRKFILNSGAAFMGTMLTGAMQKALAAPVSPTHPVGLQLFTLFPKMDDDVEDSLKKVAAIGYKEIESAYSKKPGYYGMKPKEFKNLIEGLGMAWTSQHVLGAPFKMPANAKPMLDASGKPISFPPLRNLRDNGQEIVDELAEAGIPYMVCANTPFETTEELQKSIETLNKTGEACKKAGIVFAYHNHDKEFEKLDGKVIYDTMLSDFDADLVKMELDLCWVTKAGVDPVMLFNQHPGRFPLWHIKDIDKNLTGPQPVGTGIIDFKRIFDKADSAGMKHFFVEHDMPADAYASITTSFTNVEKILKEV